MASPIIVYQRPEEGSRTPSKPCAWIAETTIDGCNFTARSRYGATNQLARQLIAAGIPGGSMIVYAASLRGFAMIPSFYRAAQWTYEETATVPLHRVPYARVEAARERAHSARVQSPKPGVSVPGGSPGAEDLSVP